MIRTLHQLYTYLDELFYEIEVDCIRCEFSRCLGYVWLLSEEAEILVDRGVEVLEVNQEIFFINSFPEEKGEIDIEKFKPKCVFLENGRCSIHMQRPLSCRMYPLSFWTEDDKLQLVLHLDCLFSKRRIRSQEFKNLSLALFGDLDRSLLGRIREAYIKVFTISKFPRGGNNFIILGTLPPAKERR